VAHGELELAKRSLRLFAEWSIVAPGCSQWSTKKSKVLVDGRDVCLSDIHPAFLSAFPLSAITSFCNVHAKVVGIKGAAYTWKHAADDFTLW